MAKTMIARMMFNPFVTTFVDEYCANFPTLELAKELKGVIDDYSFEADYDRYVMDLFMESFTPFEARLKNRDPTLFQEDKCKFAQHLEIHRIWTKDLDDGTKTTIWNYLIGAYLVVEILIRIPDFIIKEIEELMRLHYQNVVKDEFDKVAFRKAAERILMKISEPDIETLTNYMWEFVTSDATPVYSLIKDKTYHPIAKTVFDSIKTEDGRKLFMNHLSPVIDDIKNRVGESALDDQFGDVGAADSAKDGTERKERKKLSAEAEKKEKSRIISHVLDVITEVIANNKDAVKDILVKPAESLKTLVTNGVIPIILGAKKLVVKTEEQKKREREQDDEALFGGSSSSS